jgi:hypothetical protein
MKKLSLIIFIAASILASCKKDGNKGPCIEQNQGLPSVSQSDLAGINMLFQNNNLSVSNQAFFYYSSGYTQSGNSQVPYQVAEATQLRNGLPVFYSTVNYVFLNGSLTALSGKVYGAISLDNKSTLSLPVLRQLFLNEAINKQGIDATFKDSCYVAQFGYYDLNRPDAIDTAANFVKAWEVRPGHSFYPQCYIRDDNSATIFFDNGLRPFYNDEKKRR